MGVKLELRHTLHSQGMNLRGVALKSSFCSCLSDQLKSWTDISRALYIMCYLSPLHLQLFFFSLVFFSLLEPKLSCDAGRMECGKVKDSLAKYTVCIASIH